MPKALKKISKSIQFLDTVIRELDGLAKTLGLTQLRNGVEVGNVARIVAELVEYGLAHRQQFIEWKMNGRK